MHMPSTQQHETNGRGNIPWVELSLAALGSWEQLAEHVSVIGQHNKLGT